MAGTFIKTAVITKIGPTCSHLATLLATLFNSVVAPSQMKRMNDEGKGGQSANCEQRAVGAQSVSQGARLHSATLQSVYHSLLYQNRGDEIGSIDGNRISRLSRMRIWQFQHMLYSRNTIIGVSFILGGDRPICF